MNSRSPIEIEPKQEFKDLPFVQADLMNYEEIEKICEGHDAVIHLVALVRERFDKPAWLFADVMVKGTWNVAEACATGGVQRLVNISSISACSPVPGTESALPCRCAVYSSIRADYTTRLQNTLGEQVGEAYYQAHGLSVIHLRPGVIAGDGHNPGPKAPDNLDQAGPTEPWFVYVDPRDVVHRQLNWRSKPKM